MSSPRALPIALAVLVTGLAGLAAPVAAAHQKRPVRGILVEHHGDFLNGGGSAPRYVISSPSGATPVAGAQLARLVGQHVEVTDENPRRAGIQGEVRAVPRPAERNAAAVAAGPRTVLVVLVTLTNAPTPATTADAARSLVFGSSTSASAAFSAQSGGATYLTGIQRTDGDIAGPLALPLSGSGCPYNAIAASADRAAADAGWSVGSYQHVVYVLPYQADCDWSGLGSLPGRHSWVNSTAGGSGTIFHELGHNLGAHHASTARCTDGSGQPVTDSASCVVNEYGDPFDRMGARGSGVMSTFHRAQVGQLPSADQVSLTRAATIRLATADAAGGTRLALIPRKDPRQRVTSYYALERRAPQPPFDPFGPADPVVTGVSIRVVPRLDHPLQTKLLDTVPQTAGSFFDAALQPGQTFRDVPRGIAIAVGDDPSEIAVTMPDLVDDIPPSVSYLSARRVGDSAVSLWWAPALDDEDATPSYELSRDGQLLESTTQTAITVPDDGLAHSFSLVAVDDAGNRSTPVTASTQALRPPPPVPPAGDPSPPPGGSEPSSTLPAAAPAGAAPPQPAPTSTGVSARGRRALTILWARRDGAGRLVVRLRCAAAVRCAGTLRATDRAGRRLAQARVSAAAGGVVSVRLARAQRKRLPPGRLVLRFSSRAGGTLDLGTIMVPRRAGDARVRG